MYDPNSIFDLSGRSALVTGSSRGIGAAIAIGLAAAGAKVFVHGQSEASTAVTLNQINQAGGNGEAVFGDLAEAGQGRALINECERRAGRLDILVINASAQINASLADLSESDLSYQIDVNLRSTIEMLQPAAGNGQAPLGESGQHRLDQSVGAKTSCHRLCSDQGRAA